MMELHEENKLLREALDQIARYQADGPFHARRTLAAIGPASAAQPEDAADALAAEHQALLSAEATAVRWRQRAEKAEAELAANNELIIQMTKATVQSQAEYFALRDKLNKSESAQPAPQAGDALGSAENEHASPQSYMALGSMGDDKRFLYLAHQYHMQERNSLFNLYSYVDASRREAYDKGRAEGVESDHIRTLSKELLDYIDAHDWGGIPEGITADKLRSALAAPPASAAQQDSIVELNVAMLRSRSALGVAKYGTTLADNPLALQEWLQHALEESLDQSNYLQAAIQKLSVS